MDAISLFVLDGTFVALRLYKNNRRVGYGLKRIDCNSLISPIFEDIKSCVSWLHDHLDEDTDNDD